MTALHGGMGIDLEDYYHVSAFENILTEQDKADLPSYICPATELLLEIFARNNIKATFFCLGLVAEAHPELIKKIANAGHEIASHSMKHDRVRDMQPAAFQEDVYAIKALLEDITGQKVTGYRAPSFSIGKDTPFFYECLAKAGYVYSSSLNPIQHDHYGDKDAPRHAFKVDPYDILEIPVTTTEILGRRIPTGGGGWFRLMPYMLFKSLLKRNLSEGQPLIFYTHPWEFVPEQPMIKNIPLKTRFRHYVNLSRMEAKFSSLCEDFTWGRMDQLIPKAQNDF